MSETTATATRGYLPYPVELAFGTTVIRLTPHGGGPGDDAPQRVTISVAGPGATQFLPMASDSIGEGNGGDTASPFGILAGTVGAEATASAYEPPLPKRAGSVPDMLAGVLEILSGVTGWQRAHDHSLRAVERRLAALEDRLGTGQG